MKYIRKFSLLSLLINIKMNPIEINSKLIQIMIHLLEERIMVDGIRIIKKPLIDLIINIFLLGWSLNLVLNWLKNLMR